MNLDQFTVGTGLLASGILLAGKGALEKCQARGNEQYKISPGTKIGLGCVAILAGAACLSTPSYALPATTMKLETETLAYGGVKARFGAHCDSATIAAANELIPQDSRVGQLAKAIGLSCEKYIPWQDGFMLIWKTGYIDRISAKDMTKGSIGWGVDPSNRFYVGLRITCNGENVGAQTIFQRYTGGYYQLAEGLHGVPKLGDSLDYQCHLDPNSKDFFTKLDDLVSGKEIRIPEFSGDDPDATRSMKLA